MIYIDLKGGLGNQLFQIFALINLSLEKKIPFKLPINKNCNYGIDFLSKRPTYWDNFLKYLKYFTIQFEESYIVIHEISFIYNDLTNLNINKFTNIKLSGYFQSEKYFKKNYENILKLIKFEELKNNIKCKYNELFNKNYISLHFRIGDYKIKPENHPILNINYYINSINFIKEKTQINNVLYFFEKIDLEIVENNINLLKKKFQDFNFIPIPNNLEDWEQLIIMSCCEHNIIGNSSFSWWGAYLNTNKDKIICRPEIWFGPDMEHCDTSSLFPDDWKKISCL